MGAEWFWMYSSGLRNAVSCVECFGHGNYIYRTSQRTHTGDRDANSQVRRGRDQDRCRDDYDYNSAACRHCDKSRDCVGADRQNPEHYRDGAK